MVGKSHQQWLVDSDLCSLASHLCSLAVFRRILPNPDQQNMTGTWPRKKGGKKVLLSIKRHEFGLAIARHKTEH